MGSVFEKFVSRLISEAGEHTITRAEYLRAYHAFITADKLNATAYQTAKNAYEQVKYKKIKD